MRVCLTGLVAGALMGAPAAAAETACGEVLRLTVEPAGKLQDVAAVLRRRLEAAGASAPSVETEGSDTLRALLPAGASESLLTRPGRIEFRLVAATPDAQGVLAMPKLDSDGVESVEPQVILNESHLREFQVRNNSNPDGSTTVALAFQFDPRAMKNLMTATAEAVGRKLAILVDDKIVVDPVIRAPIASATGEISGGFTMDSATELAELLRNGRLPARVVIAAREPATCK